VGWQCSAIGEEKEHLLVTGRKAKRKETIKKTGT
jgi:hypothetical protein